MQWWEMRAGSGPIPCGKCETFAPHVAVGAHGFTNRPIAVYLNQGLAGGFLWYLLSVLSVVWRIHTNHPAGWEGVDGECGQTCPEGSPRSWSPSRDWASSRSP